MLCCNDKCDVLRKPNQKAEIPNRNKPNQHAAQQNPFLIHFFLHSSLHSQSWPFTLSNSTFTTSSAPCATKDSSTRNSLTLKLRGCILFAATLSSEGSPPTASPPKAYFLISLSNLTSSRLILKGLVILLGISMPDQAVLVQRVYNVRVLNLF